MTRRALLLGCGKFADSALPALRSPARDVAELERVLRDARNCGYAVSSAVDCTSQQAERQIEGFFAAARPADPMNLLYLSCHGVQDKQGRLYFAFADTERDFLGSTAVSAEWVRECINSSRSKATLVLIDCCFSGGFIKGMRARSTGPNVESLVRDLPQGSGMTVLTASGETEASFEDASAADVRPSYFTDALIAGISSGAADLNRDGRVTADELYDYIYDQVRQGPSPQRPRRLGMGEGFLVVSDAVVEPPPVIHQPPVIPRPPVVAAPFAGPENDPRRGEADGARAVRNIPLAPLAGLIACQFDVVRWLVPWREHWGQTFSRPEWAATIPSWLPELAGYLGACAAPPGSTYSTFVPSPTYLTGFCVGMRNAWAAAVEEHLLPPDQPTLTHWLATPPDGFRLAVPFAEATMSDLEDGRSQARRAAGTRTAVRVLLWLVSAFFLVGEIAVVGITATGGWAVTNGVPEKHPVANAVGANLSCAIPFVGLCVLVYFDLRRARRKRVSSRRGRGGVS
jgi:hypothetical protein